MCLASSRWKKPSVRPSRRWTSFSKPSDHLAIHIVDYHADSTSEKAIFGYVYDGKVSAVLGTHTHVQTADAKILRRRHRLHQRCRHVRRSDGVIGFEKNSVINKIVYGRKRPFGLDDHAPMMVNAVVMDFDETTLKCRSIDPDQRDRSRKEDKKWQMRISSPCPIKKTPPSGAKSRPALFDRWRPVPENLKIFAKGRSYFIRTYGCQANIRDEEVFAGYLERRVLSKPKSERSQSRLDQHLRRPRERRRKSMAKSGFAKPTKTKTRISLLVLAGCVMGENGVAEKLRKPIPISPHHRHPRCREHPALIERSDSEAERRSSMSAVLRRRSGGESPFGPLSPFEAFVNISYGCDKFCTYCIVPYTRGEKEAATPKTSSKNARIW
jgi:hypothetical protein